MKYESVQYTSAALGSFSVTDTDLQCHLYCTHTPNCKYWSRNTVSNNCSLHGADAPTKTGMNDYVSGEMKRKNNKLILVVQDFLAIE